MRTKSLPQQSKSLVSRLLNAIHPNLLHLLGVQPLQDIDEVNMFKDDNTVIHFKRPQSKLNSRIVIFLNSPILCERKSDGSHRPS